MKKIFYDYKYPDQMRDAIEKWLYEQMIDGNGSTKEGMYRASVIVEIVPNDL